MRFRVRSLVPTLVIGVALPMAGLTTSAAPAATWPDWTPPLALAGGGAEPSIRTARDHVHAAYISAPTGLGSNFWFIDQLRNPDGTFSFKPSPPRQPDLGTGGGDSEISVGDVVDPATGCVPIAYSGLHNIDLLDNFTTSASPDCGLSFSSPDLFATQNTLTDRQWQAFDGRLTNFLIFHKVDTSQIVVARSLDAGLTYTSLSPDGSQGIIDTATFPSVANANKIGNIVTDYSQPTSVHYANGERAHVLYSIFTGPKDPADDLAAQQGTGTGTDYDHNDTVYVAKSVDGGVTWVDKKVFGVDPASQRELDMVFPVIAVDRTGGLYAAWSDGFKIQYVFSTDHGTTWSKAFQINTDNRTVTASTTASDIFPWITAGGAGRLDIVWYHGNGGPAGSGGAPGSDALYHRDPGDVGTKWTVAFAQLSNATAATASRVPTPTIEQNDMNISGVIHLGDICNNGTLCGAAGRGDRTLLDFFQVAIDTRGRANIAYASDLGSPGSARTTYIRQNSGVSAIDGSPIPNYHFVALKLPTGTSCPGPQVIDPVGDAPSTILVNPGGGNIDTFDIKGVKFRTPDAGHIEITMQVANLSAVPATGTLSSLWDVFWTYNNTVYYVAAYSNGPALQTYDTGTYTDNFNSTGTPAGVFTEGANGTIKWTVARADIGNPPNGATFTSPYADDHGGFSVLGSGLRYVAAIDRAPDVRGGTRWIVGNC